MSLFDGQISFAISGVGYNLDITTKNISDSVNRIVTCLVGDSTNTSKQLFNYNNSKSVIDSVASFTVKSRSDNWTTTTGSPDLFSTFRPQFRPVVFFAIDTNNGYYVFPLLIGIDYNNIRVNNGERFITHNIANGVVNYAVPDNVVSSGLSQLVTFGNIKATVYNGKSYPPGATIPLDPSVENISLVNQNYTLTMNDAQNMKNVQIDSTVYSDFPTTINVEKNTVLQMSGKDDPVITVDYTNTKKPTVTNT